MTATLESLRESGKNVRKYRLRTALNEGRARDWVELAKEEGLNDHEIREALGFTVAEYTQLVGVA